MGIYQKYAEVYDRSGQILFAVRMIPYLDKLLARHVPQSKKALDLACGTGTIALTLEQQGYQVSGIDASEDMLAQARRKAEGANANIDFGRQDMRSFSLPERVGLITCLYDSANYLLEERDLREMFARSAASLESGGLLIFDMNTEWMMEHNLNDKTEFFDLGNVSIAMIESYDSEA
ncbi:MAG: methyltransferase domain-containing protein, partial [Chloroflexi bacterium]|nr:methyltransferase domain-containing protein [Chloroflexota bacterium]